MSGAASNPLQVYTKPFGYAAPLTNVKSNDKQMKTCDATCDEALARLKQRLISALRMIAPDWSSPYECRTDA